jgi:hypothetical protein
MRERRKGKISRKSNRSRKRGRCVDASVKEEEGTKNEVVSLICVIPVILTAVRGRLQSHKMRHFPHGLWSEWVDFSSWVL